MSIFRDLRFLREGNFDYQPDALALLETAPRQESAGVYAGRPVLVGLARAARHAVARAHTPRRDNPLCLVERSDVEEAFAAFDPNTPLHIDRLLSLFLPTTLLYTREAATLEDGFLYLRDGLAPVQSIQGLTYGHDETLSEGHAVVIAGETLLIPPAVRGEGTQRSKWVRHTDLDAPRWRDAGGPFWRLGRSGLWRLQVVSWHERLLLAALLGTNRDACILLAPSTHFPRAGFVLQTAASLERTIVCIGLEDLPPAARGVLESGRWRWMHRVDPTDEEDA